MSRIAFLLALGASFTLLSTVAGQAASSDWYAVEGGRIRLVSTGAPDQYGILRGALQVDLKPGWKTYWRDPGSAGVPPGIDLTNGATAEIDFPAPERHEEKGLPTNGYSRPLAFPVRFDVSKATGVALDANTFLGICREVCIPVQATLKLNPSIDAANALDASLVETAFASLPSYVTPEFGITISHFDGHDLVATARVKGDPKTAELFLAGVRSYYMFSQPQRTEGADGAIEFRVKVLVRVPGYSNGLGIHYTLKTSSGAVSGFIPISEPVPCLAVAPECYAHYLLD